MFLFVRFMWHSAIHTQKSKKKTKWTSQSNKSLQASAAPAGGLDSDTLHTTNILEHGFSNTATPDCARTVQFKVEKSILIIERSAPSSQDQEPTMQLCQHGLLAMK